MDRYFAFSPEAASARRHDLDEMSEWHDAVQLERSPVRHSRARSSGKYRCHELLAPRGGSSANAIGSAQVLYPASLPLANINLSVR